MMMLDFDPVWRADNQQAHFRLLLDAMARPGRCHPLTTIPQSALFVLSVLTVLLDANVTFSDPHDLLRHEDRLMLLAKIVSPEQADYILCDAARIPHFTPKLGTLPSPEQSATLILVVGELGRGDVKLRLSGPGIVGTQHLAIQGLADKWFSLRQEWVCSFPLGVDLILVDGTQLAAIPRTTRVVPG